MSYIFFSIQVCDIVFATMFLFFLFASVPRGECADVRIVVLDSTTMSPNSASLDYIIKQLMSDLELNPAVTSSNSKENLAIESYNTVDRLRKDMILVLNKTDLLDKSELSGLVAGVKESNDVTVCAVSCVTEEGIEDLLSHLKIKVADLCADPSSANPSLTQARHRYHMELCLEAVELFEEYIDTDVVMAAHQLRKAARQIGKITGKITSEEILDVVFRDFCIGK